MSLEPSPKELQLRRQIVAERRVFGLLLGAPLVILILVTIAINSVYLKTPEDENLSVNVAWAYGKEAATGRPASEFLPSLANPRFLYKDRMEAFGPNTTVDLKTSHSVGEMYTATFVVTRNGAKYDETFYFNKGEMTSFYIKEDKNRTY